MNKSEIQRQVKLREEIIRHVSDVTQNVARSCRYYGIARKTYYKWIARYNLHGTAGLTNQSHRPRVSKNATHPDVVSKILYLRQNYHFGPIRISDYLKRYHQIKIAQSSVHRILQRHNLGRLPTSKRHYERKKPQWKRNEKQQLGHQMQIYVKFLQRISRTAKRFYQFTGIDDCARIRILKIYGSCNQKTAIQFVDEVIRRLPFKVFSVQTDNGAEF